MMQLHPSVDILILGAGWTAGFLFPLLQSSNTLTFTGTTRDGRVVSGESTIEFDALAEDAKWERLPKARTVVVSFPVKKEGAIKEIIRNYEAAHSGGSERTRWIQLGSTGAWDHLALTPEQIAESTISSSDIWVTRHAPIVRPAAPRVESEFELLSLSPDTLTTVMNLAGLWGGSRSVRNFVSSPKVAGSKEALRKKGSVHFIHGIDVARAIIAVCSTSDAEFPTGERWIVADGRVYDWWDLASAFGSGGEAGRDKPIEGPQPSWVLEFMRETNTSALPRPAASLPGKHFSSIDFWERFNLSPWKARVDGKP